METTRDARTQWLLREGQGVKGDTGQPNGRAMRAIQSGVLGPMCDSLSPCNWLTNTSVCPDDPTAPGDAWKLSLPLVHQLGLPGCCVTSRRLSLSQPCSLLSSYAGGVVFEIRPATGADALFHHLADDCGLHSYLTFAYGRRPTKLTVPDQKTLNRKLARAVRKATANVQ